MATKKDPSDNTAAADLSATSQAATADPAGAATAPNPHAGGSYARDPATGELTLIQPATQPPAAMRKTQDPVSGRITKTPNPE